MRYTPRLQEASTSRPLLAAGQVIRCPEFALGLRWKSPTNDPVMVAWRSQTYIDYHIQSGSAITASDPSRAQAMFLITSVSLVESDGPDDAFPDSFRYSCQVDCVRLADDMSFTSESERIRFSLNEPMSVAQPDQQQIEIVGSVRLPIYWEGGSEYE